MSVLPPEPELSAVLYHLTTPTLNYSESVTVLIVRDDERRPASISVRDRIAVAASRSIT